MKDIIKMIIFIISTATILYLIFAWWGFSSKRDKRKYNTAAIAAWNKVIARRPQFEKSARECTLKTYDPTKAVDADWEDTH